MSKFSNVISSRSDLDWCWYLRRNGAVGERMERVLHDVGVLQPGGWASWANSSLTDTGAPAQVIVSPNCDAMSLQTEVADPASDRKTRVARVCKIIADLGHKSPPNAIREVISAGQSDHHLNYGAWLGLRMSKTKQAAILIAEMPTQATDLTGLVTSDAVTASLRMFGKAVEVQKLAYDGATGETTIFCQTTQDHNGMIADLAKVAGMPAAPLQLSVENMFAAGRPDLDRSKPWGFSLSMPKGGGTPGLALQFAAKDIFASDAKVSKMVRTHPGDHHAAYTTLDEILLPAPKGQMHHGTIGLIARHSGSPALSIAVAAPWACPLYPL